MPLTTPLMVQIPVAPFPPVPADMRVLDCLPWPDLKERTLQGLMDVCLACSPAGQTAFLVRLDQAALAKISDVEGVDVTADVLRYVRIHPAAHGWMAAGYPAIAYLASTYHVYESIRSQGRVCPWPASIPLWSRKPAADFMLHLEPRPQARDGRMFIVSNNELLPARHSVQLFDIIAHSIGFPEVPAGGNKEVGPAGVRVNVASAKDFLRAPVELSVWVSTGNWVFLCDAMRMERIALPMQVKGGAILADVSRNGRYVALISIDIDTGPLLAFYDRTAGRDSLRVSRLTFVPSQLSVADDGVLFVGGEQHGYRMNADTCVLAAYAYRQTPFGLFRLSADGGFLIRPCLVEEAQGLEGDIVLEDRRDSGCIVLPRVSPPRSYLNPWPGSIAFSVLNLLVAVAYQDGRLQVFDLQQAEGRGARVLMETDLPMADKQPLPCLCFEGLDRLHVLFRQCLDGRVYLARTTLCLGGEASC